MQNRDETRSGDSIYTKVRAVNAGFFKSMKCFVEIVGGWEFVLALDCDGRPVDHRVENETFYKVVPLPSFPSSGKYILLFILTLTDFMKNKLKDCRHAGTLELQLCAAARWKRKGLVVSDLVFYINNYFIYVSGTRY